MVTGILLVGIGATLMGTGTGVYASSGGCGTPPVVPEPEPRGINCPRGTGRTTGMAIMVAGTIQLGAGRPALGHRRQPGALGRVRRQPARASASVGAPRAFNVSAARQRDPIRGVALTWQF